MGQPVEYQQPVVQKKFCDTLWYNKNLGHPTEYEQFGTVCKISIILDTLHNINNLGHPVEYQQPAVNKKIGTPCIKPKIWGTLQNINTLGQSVKYQ